jgi:hypothetical protein
MGWRAENERELTTERDMRRWPWRERLIYRARGIYWIAMLAILGALYLVNQLQ